MVMQTGRYSVKCETEADAKVFAETLKTIGAKVKGITASYSIQFESEMSWLELRKFVSPRPVAIRNSAW